MRETCVNMVYELAKQDERVVFIGSDLSPGLLGKMKEDFPDRHYMESVYEQNIIGMAAVLAMEGYILNVHNNCDFHYAAVLLASVGEWCMPNWRDDKL